MAALGLDDRRTRPLGHGTLGKGGIILSSVATKYRLGLTLHAGALIVPLTAPRPHSTWESAMNAAFPASTSPAKEVANFVLSRNRYPSCGGRIGGTGAPGGGSWMSVATDSPLSGAKAVTSTSRATFGSLPASVMTAPPQADLLTYATNGLRHGFRRAPRQRVGTRLQQRTF